MHLGEDNPCSVAQCSMSTSCISLCYLEYTTTPQQSGGSLSNFIVESKLKMSLGFPNLAGQRKKLAWLLAKYGFCRAASGSWL